MIPDFILQTSQSLKIPIFIEISDKNIKTKTDYFLSCKILNIKQMQWIQKIQYEICLKYDKNKSNKDIFKTFENKIVKEFLIILKEYNAKNINIDFYKLSINFVLNKVNMRYI